MLTDRYDPVDLFALVPKLSLQMEPVLVQLDRLLEDDELFQLVRADLAQRSPQTLVRGRHSTPVEVILRMLVIKRLYGWSYEETEQFVSDSLVLRQFCRLYLAPAPDDTTLIRWANQIGASTVERLNERVVELARQRKVTRGRKLRVDSTVVETNIHHPTDGSLLADGVRMLSRLLRRAKAVLGPHSGLPTTVFRNRTGSARGLVRILHRAARRRSEAAKRPAGTPPAPAAAGKGKERKGDAREGGGETGAGEAGTPPRRGEASGERAQRRLLAAQAAMKEAYEQLIGIAKESRRQASKVCERLRDRSEKAAQRLVTQFDRLEPLLSKVIHQARRRVLEGEKVPAKAKCHSLVEPHTQMVKRGKAGQPVEFGRKVWLAEVEGGIVSGYQVLDQIGPEEQYVPESLTRHQRQFGRAPELLTGDRGVSSPQNEEQAKAAGVKRVVLPAVGKASEERRAQEKERWWVRGYRWRAGIEGRTSVLKRGFGLDRCLERGEAGMRRGVGWGIVVSNLRQIARATAGS